jgi:hypothetical protein
VDGVYGKAWTSKCGEWNESGGDRGEGASEAYVVRVVRLGAHYSNCKTRAASSLNIEIKVDASIGIYQSL